MHLYSASSPIHGMGLFTNRSIGKGEAIDITFTQVNNTGIFKNDFKENPYGRFTNHSNTPNAVTVIRANYIVLKATKNINTGEEITVNYKQLIELFNNDESLIRLIKFW